MADLFTSGILWDQKISKFISLYNGLFGYTTFVILRFVLKGLEWTGHGVPWIIYCVSGLLANYSSNEKNAIDQKWSDKQFQMYLFVMLGLIIDLIVIAVLKMSVQRPRPSYNEGDLPLSASKVDCFSFPSGHATRAFMLYIVLPAIQFSPSLEVLILPWALFLAYSRVALGRHYLSDVVTGIIVGLIEGWTTIYLGSLYIGV